MCSPLKIFCDSPLGDAAIQIVRQAIAPHELLLPQTATTSVLSSAAHSLTDIDIAFGQPSPASILESPKLKWVQITSAGYTRYDTPEFKSAAQKRALIVTNSSHVYDAPCAEHVFAFILAQARQLPLSLHSRCEAGSTEWNTLRAACPLLQGQTILILGYGAIAKYLIRMLAPFDVHISATRRNPRGDETVPIIAPSDLPSALSRADHVINILPDNADTQKFISAERLAQMKSGAAFYNIGRGTTVDQHALAQALQSGHLAAAWLDVTDPEPLPLDHPLLHTKNCHITPHVAGGTRNEFERLA